MPLLVGALHARWLRVHSLHEAFIPFFPQCAVYGSGTGRQLLCNLFNSRIPFLWKHNSVQINVEPRPRRDGHSSSGMRSTSFGRVGRDSNDWVACEERQGRFRFRRYEVPSHALFTVTLLRVNTQWSKRLDLKWRRTVLWFTLLARVSILVVAGRHFPFFAIPLCVPFLFLCCCLVCFTTKFDINCMMQLFGIFGLWPSERDEIQDLPPPKKGIKREEQ